MESVRLGTHLIELMQFVTKPGNTSLRLSLLALPLYSPLIFFTGVIAVVQSFVKRDSIKMFYSFTLIASFLSVLVLPGRQLLQLIWVTVPLLILATDLITRSLSRI